MEGIANAQGAGGNEIILPIINPDPSSDSPCDNQDGDNSTEAVNEDPGLWDPVTNPGGYI